MNPFFEISEDEKLPDEALALRSLGTRQAWIMVGRRRSDYWGTPGTESKTFYRDTTMEDYDGLFVDKICRWKPIYDLQKVVEHHYNYYKQNNGNGKDDYSKHMRYVILPLLKKRRNNEVCIELFEKCLECMEQCDKQGAETVGPAIVSISKTVHRIHFDDLSWSDFERLIFAYVKRIRTWVTLDWFGQSGHDEGQDIWGESQGKIYCYQCANYRALTLKKAKDDIDKLIKAATVPDHLIFVCGGKVSAKVNKAVNAYAHDNGINNIEVWSGADIEENMRNTAPDLLERFFNGNSFPNMNAEDPSDSLIIKDLFDSFDRPAFTTAFRNEVNIPDFGKAITDTIEILNTGMHRLRDGTLIKKISSRHQLKNPNLRSNVAIVYNSVVELRDKFFDLCRTKEIKNCECGDPSCSIYTLSEKACSEMDRIRNEIFNTIRGIKPDSNLTV